MDALTQHFTKKGQSPNFFDDVVHIQTNSSDQVIDILYFQFGCVVIWSADLNQEKEILNELLTFSSQPMQPPIYLDFISYKYDSSLLDHSIDEESNQIVLKELSSFTKLAVSYALAQSVKLNALEDSVNNILKQTTPLRQELASTGRVSLSKTEISKQIGFLFNERYSINLTSDVLDTPEFFWRKPSYEPLYLQTTRFQDIQVRQNILNRRLDMIHEFYDLLSNELNHKSSTRLEFIIIFLITIEVLLAFKNNLF